MLDRRRRLKPKPKLLRCSRAVQKRKLAEKLLESHLLRIRCCPRTNSSVSGQQVHAGRHMGPRKKMAEFPQKMTRMTLILMTSLHHSTSQNISSEYYLIIQHL